MKTQTFASPCEAFIMHRDELLVKPFGDPAALPFRACVRTGNGVMHWEWFKTEDQAQNWINEWKGGKSKLAADSA